MRRWTILAGVIATLGLSTAAGQTCGPGAETFAPGGRFVFRNEAEAIGRKIATSRTDLQEPIQIVEVTLEAVPDAPAARGWNVVVVARVPGGCHLVRVGLTANEGRVYRIADKRVTPAKAPRDCERWFVLGGPDAPASTPLAAVERTAPPSRTPPPRATPAPTPEDTGDPLDEMPVIDDTPEPVATRAANPNPTPAKTPPGPSASPTKTAFASANPDATPAPTPRVKRGRPPNQLTRELVVLIATEFATELGWTEIEPKLSDLTGGRWRQDVLGRTKKGKGCGVYKLELTAPEWTMRYQVETTRGKSMGECREWYVREGRGELTDGWEEGEVEW